MIVALTFNGGKQGSPSALSLADTFVLLSREKQRKTEKNREKQNFFHTFSKY
jgi:hypothetical protein